MDGTESGWGRPAEPAPRWRALLDRALLGARTGEQQQVSDRGEDRRWHDEPGGPRRGDEYPGDERRADGYRGAERRADEYRGDERRADERGSLPSRPVNPLDRRARNPLEHNPLDDDQTQAPGSGFVPDGPRARLERPVNPLAPRRGEPALPQRSQNSLDRPVNPLERPVNPLDRRRAADGFPVRGEPSDEPHSFFNPATRAVPPPIARVTKDTGYASARAAASVGSAAVLPPPPELTARPEAPPRPETRLPETRLPETRLPETRLPETQQQALRADASAARIEWRQAQQEQEVERAVSVLRRQLGQPRVLAFANPKGGVHKTTATVLAAATAGRVRGRGVVAWDDNELRGTLGLRAGSARHARTIRHLVSDLPEIDNLHAEALTDRLDDYLRHASDGSYDVLAGEENPRFAQRLDQHTVRRVMDLLRRTHDVICVDTGNNVESVNWQTVMRAADQLVITTVPREDAAFTADWMLDLLNDIGMEELAANAVTLISCPSPGELPLLEDLKKHFATRTRAVAVVPYDPALEVGSSIEYSLLQQDTRNAWLRAASVMLEPFAQ